MVTGRVLKTRTAAEKKTTTMADGTLRPCAERRRGFASKESKNVLPR